MYVYSTLPPLLSTWTSSKQYSLLPLQCQQVLMPMLILCATTVGKTLAYTSIRFTNEQEELVARGSHTK